MEPIEFSGYAAVEVGYSSSDGRVRLLFDKFHTQPAEHGDTQDQTALVYVHSEAVEELLADLLAAVPTSLANEAILQAKRNRALPG